MLAILDKRGEHLLISYLGKNTPTIEKDVIQVKANSNIAAYVATPYTVEEKYNALKEQNPFLETFVQELGLQF